MTAFPARFGDNTPPAERPTSAGHPAPAAAPAGAVPRAAAVTGYWAWCGAHGGAGTSTLAAAVPGGIDLGRRLPWEAALGGLPAVVVCRSTAAGFTAARQFAAAASGRTVLLGLVVVADIPEKRRPKLLADHLYVTAGAFGGRVWELPWIGAWRLGEPPSAQTNPPEIPALLRALWRAVDLPLPGGNLPTRRS